MVAQRKVESAEHSELLGRSSDNINERHLDRKILNVRVMRRTRYFPRIFSSFKMLALALHLEVILMLPEGLTTAKGRVNAQLCQAYREFAPAHCIISSRNS